VARAQRVLTAVDLEAKDTLNGNGNGHDDAMDGGVSAQPTPPKPSVPTISPSGSPQRVTREEAALVKALQNGGSREEDVSFAPTIYWVPSA
jgi:hypothetical protein